MAETNYAQYVHTDAEIMGGVPVFIDTRVPIQTLFDYLEGGESLDEFLDDFPTVKREQAIGLLESLKQGVLESFHESAA